MDNGQQSQLLHPLDSNRSRKEITLTTPSNRPSGPTGLNTSSALSGAQTFQGGFSQPRQTPTFAQANTGLSALDTEAGVYPFRGNTGRLYTYNTSTANRCLHHPNRFHSRHHHLLHQSVLGGPVVSVCNNDECRKYHCEDEDDDDNECTPLVAACLIVCMIGLVSASFAGYLFMAAAFSNGPSFDVKNELAAQPRPHGHNLEFGPAIQRDREQKSSTKSPSSPTISPSDPRHIHGASFEQFKARGGSEGDKDPRSKTRKLDDGGAPPPGGSYSGRDQFKGKKDDHGSAPQEDPRSNMIELNEIPTDAHGKKSKADRDGEIELLLRQLKRRKDDLIKRLSNENDGPKSQVAEPNETEKRESVAAAAAADGSIAPAGPVLIDNNGRFQALNPWPFKKKK